MRWSDTADESLADIEGYLRRFSDEVAEAWVRRIREAVRASAVYPRSHRRVPELNDDQLRELIVGAYRIWYRILDSEERIEVMVVFHGSRDVP